jgi:hypothetical protein
VKIKTVVQYRVSFEELLTQFGIEGELAEVAYFDRLAGEVVFHVTTALVMRAA